MSIVNVIAIVIFLVFFIANCSSNGHNSRHSIRSPATLKLSGKGGDIERANARINKRQDDEVIDATGTDDQVAEFDLASFIQNSQDNEENIYKYAERNRNYNDYDSMMDADLFDADNLNHNLNIDTERNTDSSDFNKKVHSYNPKYFDYTGKSTEDEKLHKVSRAVANETNPSNQFKSIVKNKIKKCSMKEMTFPFFFHNNTRKSKPSSNKRNFFHKKSKPLKTSTTPIVRSELNTIKPERANEDPDSYYRISKRSFRDFLCPLCIKNLSKMNNGSKTNEITKKHKIHNARQFYQHADDNARKAVVSSDEDTLNQQEYDKLYTDRKEFSAERKCKRDYNKLKAKQEKEIDEIQKKVEELDIAPPKPKDQDETVNEIN